MTILNEYKSHYIIHTEQMMLQIKTTRLRPFIKVGMGKTSIG